MLLKFLPLISGAGFGTAGAELWACVNSPHWLLCVLKH